MPPTDEQKMRLNLHLNFLGQVLLVKTGILPIIATLAASLLVVATFNDRLLPLTVGVRIAIIILLFVIPPSLFSTLWETETAIEKTIRAVEDVVGEKITLDEPKCKCEKIKNWWLSYAGYIFSLVITSVILYFVWLIYKSL